MEILLDENVSSKEDVLALGIQTGDIIAMDPRTVITKSGYIKSRFLDDKLSAAILLGLARAIQDEDWELNRKVSLLFTVYEEVGHGGCFIPQDTEEMLSVDMGCVGADLGCTERMVSICAKDSGGPYNYDLVTTLSNIAREQKLDYAIDIYPHYGSDVEASLRAGYDIRHGLIGPGVYASHNYERSHVNGVRCTFELLKTYITEITNSRITFDHVYRIRSIRLFLSEQIRVIIFSENLSNYYIQSANPADTRNRINMTIGTT